MTMRLKRSRISFRLVVKRQDRHHLAGHRDVETGLARPAIRLGAKAADDAAQFAVVDIHHATPGDAVGIDAQFVALEDMVVDHGRQQIVGRGDGVDVAGHVQIELLHGHDLAVAAAGSAALDAEGRPLRGLTDGDGRRLADVLHGLAQPDRGGRLALAQRRRRDGRDQNVFGVWAILEFVDGFELDLGDLVAVDLDVTSLQAHLFGDGLDRFQRGCLGDLDVAWDCRL